MATPTKIPTNGNDYLVFTAASEHIKGNGGNDTIKAGSGNDKVPAVADRKDIFIHRELLEQFEVSGLKLKVFRVKL